MKLFHSHLIITCIIATFSPPSGRGQEMREMKKEEASQTGGFR